MTRRDLWLRLRAILFPARTDADLHDELEFHVEMRTRRNVQGGMSPDEARREARRAFGSRALAADACRDERRTGAFDHLRRDVRHALRSLARHPGFTAVAVLTLALGIGASTALFGIADPLLMRPLPVRAPEELVLFRTIGSPVFPGWAADGLAPYPLFERVQSGTTAFAQAFALEHEDLWTRMRVRDGDDSATGENVRTVPVSGAFFEVLGVSPVLGRVFTEADDRPGAPLLAVISHAFWQRRHGGVPDVVGTTLSLELTNAIGRLSALTATIVGVAPRGFQGVDLDRVPDVWLTRIPALEAPWTGQTRGRTMINADRMNRVMARLRPGVGLAQAQAEVDVLTGSALQGLPARLVDAGTHIRVEAAATGYSSLRDKFRHPLRLLTPAVGFVLLMACVNVAALLLTRTTSRQKEIAVRLSLGGGPLAIVRLLLTEGLLLAAAGGAIGWLVFRWVRLGAAAYLPAESGLQTATTFDTRLLVFAIGVSLLSALLTSLVPVVWIARSDTNRLMREPTGQSQFGSVAGLHRLIVPLQMALALMLLVGAMLALRTVQNLRAVDVGFAPDRVIQFSLKGQRALVPARLLERLETLPGVESLTSYVSGGPLQDEGTTATLQSISDTPREARNVSVVIVRSGFFETLDVRLVAGRDVIPEGTGAFGAAILSESLARHLFGQPEAAVGRTVIEQDFALAPNRLVVGVVRDVPHASLRETGAWTMYQTQRRTPIGFPTTNRIVLRTTTGAASLVPSVRSAVAEFGDGLEMQELRTFRDITEASIAGERLLAQVSGILGGLAVLLAALGLSGVIAFAVARRTPELGLRMALGAQVGDVIGLVVRHVLVLVAAGLGVGLAGAWFGMRLTSSLLFGVTPHDPATLGAAVLVLIVIAAAAAYIPAYRAARRIDPIVALRSE